MMDEQAAKIISGLKPEATPEVRLALAYIYLTDPSQQQPRPKANHMNIDLNEQRSGPQENRNPVCDMVHHSIRCTQLMQTDFCLGRKAEKSRNMDDHLALFSKVSLGIFVKDIVINDFPKAGGISSIFDDQVTGVQFPAVSYKQPLRNGICRTSQQCHIPS